MFVVARKLLPVFIIMFISLPRLSGLITLSEVGVVIQAENQPNLPRATSVSASGPEQLVRKPEQQARKTEPT